MKAHIMNDLHAAKLSFEESKVCNILQKYMRETAKKKKKPKPVLLKSYKRTDPTVL